MSVNISGVKELRSKFRRIIGSIEKQAETLEKNGVDTSVSDRNEESPESGKKILITQALRNLSQRIESESFKVLIIGEFKNGKSTFINAMLGKKVLPDAVIPCTAVISEVVYGTKQGVTMHFLDELPEIVPEYISEKVREHIAKNSNRAGGIPPLEMTFNELKECVTIPEELLYKDNPENELYASESEIQDENEAAAEAIGELPYKKAEIHFPLDILRDGVEIIDTPGLNEDEAREKVTRDYLKEADAIIFLFTQDKILGMDERKIVAALKVAHDDMFFVINKMDNVKREKDRADLIAHARKKLSPLTCWGDKGIFFVSALNALESHNDEGMKEFEAALSDYLVDKKVSAKFGSVSKELVQWISSLIMSTEERINTLRTELDDNEKNLEDSRRGLSAAREKRKSELLEHTERIRKRNEEMKRKVSEAKSNLRRAENERVNITQRLDNARNELYSSVQIAMSRKYDQLLERVPDYVKNMKTRSTITATSALISTVTFGFVDSSEKEKKALAKEVVDNLKGFFEAEMLSWAKKDLRKMIEDFITQLRNELKQDLENFYRIIDDFAYSTGGQKADISDVDVFERLGGVVTGLAMGAAGYTAAGAILGFGTINSLIAGLLTEMLGMTVLKNLLLGGGILSLVLIGWELWNFEDNATSKCKEEIGKRFVDEMRKQRSNVCERYALDISDKLRKQLQAVDNALLVEVDRRRTIAQAMEKDTEAALSDTQRFDDGNFLAMEKKFAWAIEILEAKIPDLKKRISALSDIYVNLKGQSKEIQQMHL